MDNPISGLVEEFKKAPPAGKALAVTAVVVVAGLGLYVAHVTASSGGTATGSSNATYPGIDAGSIGANLTGSASNLPSSSSGIVASLPSSASSVISTVGSNTLVPPKGFVSKASGFSGYESGTSVAYYNNGSLQGTGLIGDIANFGKTVAPKNFVAAKSGASGYESNGYGVYYNNGSLQSVVTLPHEASSFAPTPIPKTVTSVVKK